MSSEKGLALEAMLDAIKAVTRDEAQPALDRKSIVDILEVIAEHLDPLLHEPVAQDDASEVALEHTAVAQLRGLASALQDLDTGLTDPVFNPYQHGANATLPWRVRATDDALVQALSVYQKKFNLTQKEAAARMAAKLTAGGFLRKGEKLSRSSLQRLKYGSGKRSR